MIVSKMMDVYYWYQRECEYLEDIQTVLVGGYGK